MKRARTRAGCSCVSEKEILHTYNDDHGRCLWVGVDDQGNDFIESRRIRTAKIRCPRCYHISLQKIPAP